MVDPCDRGSESEEMSCKTSVPKRVSSDGTNVKTCVDCGTSRTPLWRGGPAGPKSLCNACGIRSRKKRRALMGVTKEEKKIKRSASGKNLSHQSSSSNSSTSSCGDCTLKDRLWAFGRDVAFQRPRSNTTQRRKKMGEVEQAAFLLMAYLVALCTLRRLAPPAVTVVPYPATDFVDSSILYENDES